MYKPPEACMRSGRASLPETPELDLASPLSAHYREYMRASVLFRSTASILELKCLFPPTGR